MNGYQNDTPMRNKHYNIDVFMTFNPKQDKAYFQNWSEHDSSMSEFTTNMKWASSWDYGTYHIGDQRRLRRACASAQSRQSLRCSRTWMEADEGPTKHPIEWLRMGLRTTKRTIISWAGSNIHLLIISRLFIEEPLICINQYLLWCTIVTTLLPRYFQ